MAKWLSVVGIGEDGITGLGSAALRCIEAAEFVFGGRRLLRHAAAVIRGESRTWPSPFDGAVAQILALRGRAVCVLASGDPMHFGIGALLARELDASEMTVLPGLSAFSLTAARLGWALQDCDTISLHGRAIERIRPLLHPGRRVVALTSDGDAPARIARLVAADGFGASRFIVLEALGGAHERVRSFCAAAVDETRFDDLNVVAIDVEGGAEARILPLGTGLDDAFFEHDGQITKREVRAVTVAALAPRRGELLWDIGAGAGSVAIEWMLLHPSLRAVAVEASATRAERIRHNAAACGVPDLRVIAGCAPQALAGLPQADALFIGGGADEAMIDIAVQSLRAGGRLVVNAVTLETEALLLGVRGRLGGEIVRIGIERAAPLGELTGWRPAMPVLQWRWSKR